MDKEPIVADDWLNEAHSSEPNDEDRYIVIDRMIQTRKRIQWLWTWAKALPVGVGIAYAANEILKHLTRAGL